MSARELVEGTGASMLAGIAGFLLVLLSADPGARSAAARALLSGQPAPMVVIEPAVFVGMVEVTEDAEHGSGVLLSTETQEVVVADNAVSKTLAEFEGEVVAVRGRLIESPQGPPTMVVREFRVLGRRAPPEPGGDERLISAPGAGIAC